MRELPPEPDSPAPEEEEGEKEKPEGEDGKSSPAAEEKPAEEKPAKEKTASEDAEGDAPMPEKEEEVSENKENKEPEEGDVDMEKKEPETKAPEKKVREKRYEWVDVVRKKRRTKKTDLPVSKTGVPGYSEDLIQKRQDEEFAMQAEMREILDTDEKRNDLEGYIFNTRDKISSSNEWGAYISDVDRDSFNSALTAAEDWLYDTPDATKAQYIEKVEELKATGDPIVWRFKEAGMRADWISAVSGTVKNYRAAAETPGEKYGHISPDKLGKIVSACTELEKWLDDMKAKQDKLSKHEKPVLICADMERKNQELAKMADEILREPKPAPPKPEKKEEPAKEEEEEPKVEESPKEEDGEKKEAAEPPAEEAQNMDVD